jgi:hypothetical protein
VTKKERRVILGLFQEMLDLKGDIETRLEEVEEIDEDIESAWNDLDLSCLITPTEEELQWFWPRRVKEQLAYFKQAQQMIKAKPEDKEEGTA